MPNRRVDIPSAVMVLVFIGVAAYIAAHVHHWDFGAVFIVAFVLLGAADWAWSAFHNRVGFIIPFIDKTFRLR